VKTEDLRQRAPGEVLDALVELDERHLELERQGAADRRLARAAQADQGDALAAVRVERDVAQLAQRRAERARERGQLDHREVGPPGLGVGHVATAQTGPLGQGRHGQMGAPASLAQSPAELEEKALVFHEVSAKMRRLSQDWAIYCSVRPLPRL